METFEINTEYIELIKLLKAAQIVGSGAEAKLLVDDGAVYLNGQQELRKRAKLRPGDVVKVDEIEIKITTNAR